MKKLPKEQEIGRETEREYGAYRRSSPKTKQKKTRDSLHAWWKTSTLSKQHTSSSASWKRARDTDPNDRQTHTERSALYVHKTRHIFCKMIMLIYDFNQITRIIYYRIKLPFINFSTKWELNGRQAFSQIAWACVRVSVVEHSRHIAYTIIETLKAFYLGFSCTFSSVYSEVQFDFCHFSNLSLFDSVVGSTRFIRIWQTAICHGSIKCLHSKYSP